MISYQSRNQIQHELHRMLPYQIKECKECDELPLALEQLIKHNFQATFVCYDKKTNTIEVGVEDQEELNSYPNITVHKFSLEEAVTRLNKTLKTTDQDLKFYGKLLAATGSHKRIDEVVLV
ncbi:hypothetical protein [Salinimicrobium gaetbulicola]|uniref:Uncharacterized protein n=1 Tax=Salinimicrobium gaetbulicola TaxID=999702 RepID=A0ABW3IEJ1_9FLAO